MSEHVQAVYIRALETEGLLLDERQARLCLAQGEVLLAKAATEAAAVRVPDRPIRLLTRFRSRDEARRGEISKATVLISEAMTH